jgi:hypothetical protein
MPTYRPAGEDGPNAMMAQAEAERREHNGRKARGKIARWEDPVKAGWPGPMKEWTPAMTACFDAAYARALASGWPEPRAFSFAYGAVTRMPEGRR